MTVPQSVVLRGVEKRFGDVTAVARLDLEVQPGELMVLVGPVRLRQEHPAAPDRGAGGAHCGGGVDRGAARP